MINLELTSSDSQTILDINKSNHIVLGNYDGYIKFYNYFYEVLVKKNKEYMVRLSNKSLDYKNTIMFDFTSVSSIFSSLEYKKGTLLYEYMVSKYTYIDSLAYEKMFNLYDELHDILNNNEDGIVYNIIDDLNKLLYDGIELSYNKDATIVVFKKILKKYLDNNYTKTVLLFINSDILDFNLDLYDNVYYFDISSHEDIGTYNLISYDNIMEIDFSLINEYIKDKYPLHIEISLIDKLIKKYYSFFAFSEEIDVYNEEELVIYTLLSKKASIHQKIIPKDFIISDSINSFLASS